MTMCSVVAVASPAPTSSARLPDREAMRQQDRLGAAIAAAREQLKGALADGRGFAPGELEQLCELKQRGNQNRRSHCGPGAKIGGS